MAGPRPVVCSGPSGVGKSTLLKKLMKEYEGVFGFSISRKCVCLCPCKKFHITFNIYYFAVEVC